VQNLAQVGVTLENRSVSLIRTSRKEIPKSADEHFITGFDKLIDPAKNVLEGRKQALQEFSKAIQMDYRISCCQPQPFNQLHQQILVQ
jgi:hypothetical protein